MRSCQLRIGIVGGGIGGLALAVALCKLKLDNEIKIDIYESAAKLTQVGAGITLWPRGWEILKSWGLEESLAAKFAVGQELPRLDVLKSGFLIKKSDMKNPIFITDCIMPGGSVSFHRADVQDVLLQHLSSNVEIHLSHRLMTYHHRDNGEIELQFRNEGVALCDLLIGADGINSAVRKEFLAEGTDWTDKEKRKKAEPLWTGTIVYRNLIDAEKIRRESPNHLALTRPVVYCGKNKHVVAYPVLQGKLINTIPFLSEPDKEDTYFNGPAVVENSSDNFIPYFEGWEDEVQVLIKSMSKPSRWAIQVVSPLDTYVSKTGNVILLGDAAHAMPTHLGNGAGQAIEDAFILSNLISKFVDMGLVDLRKITKIYDSIRQPFGNFAAAASKHQGHFYEFSSPGFDNVKDGDALSTEKVNELKRHIEDGWRWTYQSPMPDLRKALDMIHRQALL